MKPQAQSEIELRLADSLDTISERWLAAMTTGGKAPLATTEARQQLTELTGRVIGLLCAEEPAEGEAEAVGADLVRLQDVRPEDWGQTLETLARLLLEGLPAQEAAVFQPRLASLLGRMAAGLAQAVFNAVPHDLERAADLATADGKLQREVAERVWAEEALRESESRARFLLKTPADAIALIDSESTILDLNETMARRFGGDANKLIGLRCWDLLPPDLAKDREQRMEEALTSGRPVRFEDEHDGTWLDNLYYPIMDEQGNIGGLAIWAHDITERKGLERALERRVAERTADLIASEALYRTLFECNADALFIVDMQGRYLDVNPAACQMLGYSREELLTMGIFEVGAQSRLIPPDQRPEYLDRRRTVWRQGKPRYLTYLIGKGGKRVPVEVAVNPLSFRGEETVLSAARDVSERRRAQEALQRSEERLRAQYDRMPIPTYTWQVRGSEMVLIDHNTAAGEVSHSGTAEMVGITLSESHGHCPHIMEAMWRCFSEKTYFTQELHCQFATMDEPRDLVATYAYVPPDLVLVHTQDQTERKQAQDALQKSEQELRSLYMGIPVPTYTWQKTADRLVLVDHNDADIQMGQAGLGDFLGMPAREILRNTPAICDTLWQCLDQEKSSSWEGLFQHPTTGEHRHLVLKCAYVPPDRVLVQTEDITERKKAEEALHRSRQETLRSRDILQALGQAAQAIQRSLTVEEVYESIGKQAERLGYRAFVLAVAEDRSHLVLSHASLKGAALPKAEKLLGMSTAGLRIPLVPDGFLGPLLSRGDSLYCQRTADLIFRGVPHLGRTLIQRLVAILGVERSIYAPLEIYGEIEGMLAIGGSDLEKVDVPAVTAFAIQAAIALEHARLLAQVRSIGERLRQLAHSTVSAQEEERRRLSRALHDDAGQDLTALGISLQLIRQDLPREARFLRPRLDDAASLASKTLDQLRLLARDLRPPALDAIGLDRALHELCRDFARRTGIAVEYHGSDCSALPEVVSISLYRFLQEALTNAARHARSQHIHAALSIDAAEAILVVEDDGQGFDREVLFSDSGPPRGIGLLDIMERLETLQGRLEIESHPGQGTRLAGHIPLTGDAPRARKRQ